MVRRAEAVALEESNKGQPASIWAGFVWVEDDRMFACFNKRDFGKDLGLSSAFKLEPQSLAEAAVLPWQPVLHPRGTQPPAGSSSAESWRQPERVLLSVLAWNSSAGPSKNSCSRAQVTACLLGEKWFHLQSWMNALFLDSTLPSSQLNYWVFCSKWRWLAGILN